MNTRTTSAIALAALLGAAPLAMARTQTMNETTSSSHRGASTEAITEAQAKREIQLDGYSHIQNIRHEKQGWVATANEGNHQVKLLVDRFGNVKKL